MKMFFIMFFNKNWFCSLNFEFFILCVLEKDRNAKSKKRFVNLFLIGSYFIIINTYTIFFVVLQSSIIRSCHLEGFPEVACIQIVLLVCKNSGYALARGNCHMYICQTIAWNTWGNYWYIQLTNLDMYSPSLMIMASWTCFQIHMFKM